jgi:hypothetical protein
MCAEQYPVHASTGSACECYELGWVVTTKAQKRTCRAELYQTTMTMKSICGISLRLLGCRIKGLVNDERYLKVNDQGFR